MSEGYGPRSQDTILVNSKVRDATPVFSCKVGQYKAID